LDLTPDDISNAGIASVCGTIFSRVAMGTLTDVLGPRYSAAIALLLTAPLMFGIALIQTAAGFIALRMLVGLGLSMFVVCQKWMGVMFNRQVLGRATALSAGEQAGLVAFSLAGLSDGVGQP
jgi:NNP family nitrate/nitrite transporter-like MFS transporter